jgi:hypothetical protein
MVKNNVNINVEDNILTVRPFIYEDGNLVSMVRRMDIILIQSDNLINEVFAVFDQETKVLFVSPAQYELIIDPSLTKTVLKQLEIIDLHTDKTLNLFQNI